MDENGKPQLLGIEQEVPTYSDILKRLEALPSSRWERVVAHGDYLPGTALWDEGEVHALTRALGPGRRAMHRHARCSSPKSHCRRLRKGWLQRMMSKGSYDEASPWSS